MIFRKQEEEGPIRKKELYILTLAFTLSTIHLPIILAVADTHGGNHVRVGIAGILFLTLVNYAYALLTRNSKRINVYRKLLFPLNLMLLVASWYFTSRAGIQIEGNVAGFTFAFLCLAWPALVRFAVIGHIMLYGPIDGKTYPIHFYTSLSFPGAE